MPTRAMTPTERLRFSLWRDEAADLLPYLAPILFAFRPVACDDVDSFAVDEGLRCYVNTEAVQHWSPRLLAIALLHECGHVWSEHAERARALGVARHQHQAWNVAADCSINDDLMQAGLTEIEDFWLPSGLGEPDHLEAEHYYAVLKARQGDPQPADGQDCEPYAGCGAVAGNPGPGQLPDDGGQVGPAAAGASAADVVEVLDATAYAVERHTNEGRGSVPAGLEQFMQQRLAPPVVPWRNTLRSVMRRTLHTHGRGRRTTTKRNRRRHAATLGGRPLILPGQQRPVLRVVFIRDTSGSMRKSELQAAGIEVEGVCRAAGIRGDNLQVIDVDSRAHPPRPYRSVDTLNIIQGRGGTDMGAGLEAAAQMRPAPTVVIVATDGDTGWPTQLPPFPVIGLFIGRAAKRFAAGAPSWMRVIQIPSA